MRIKLFILILFIFAALSFQTFAKTQKEEYQNDFLYSEEYFNYVIEQASLERQEAEEAKKIEAKNLKKKEKTHRK